VSAASAPAKQTPVSTATTMSDIGSPRFLDKSLVRVHSSRARS
jgi:hypothetical protein